MLGRSKATLLRDPLEWKIAASDTRSPLLACIRDRLCGWAHVTPEDGITGVSPDQRGARPPGHPHTIWQLLEHLRICQDDLVEYSRDPNYTSPDFPEGYWPE